MITQEAYKEIRYLHVSDYEQKQVSLPKGIAAVEAPGVGIKSMPQ